MPLIRAMWMKGPRRRIPTPGTNRRRAFFGALDAMSGHWFSADHERKLAVHFVAFLQRLAAAYPTGTLYLALDNAPTHTAKVVGKWLAAHPARPRPLVAQVRRATPGQPGRAHLGPDERRQWLLIGWQGSIEELAAAARRFFAELAPHPVKLPSAA